MRKACPGGTLGVPGQVDHPRVIEMTKRMVEACLDKGIVVGNFTETPDQTAFWMEQGLRYMSFSVDVGILYEAGRKLVWELQRGVPATAAAGT